VHVFGRELRTAEVHSAVKDLIIVIPGLGICQGIVRRFAARPI